MPPRALGSRKQDSLSLYRLPRAESPHGLEALVALIGTFGWAPTASRCAWALGVLQTNSVAVHARGIHNDVLGSAVYARIAWINHSCDPNAFYTQSPGDSGALALDVVALRDVTAAEALTVSYVSPLEPRAGRRRHLEHHFNFACHCARCVSSASPGARLDAVLLVSQDAEADAYLTAAADRALTLARTAVSDGAVHEARCQVEAALDGLSRFAPPTHARAIRLYMACAELYLHHELCRVKTEVATTGHAYLSEGAAAAVGYALLTAVMTDRCRAQCALVGLTCCARWARVISMSAALQTPDEFAVPDLPRQPRDSWAAHWTRLVDRHPPLGRYSVHGTCLARTEHTPGVMLQGTSEQHVVRKIHQEARGSRNTLVRIMGWEDVDPGDSDGIGVDEGRGWW